MKIRQLIVKTLKMTLRSVLYFTVGLISFIIIYLLFAYTFSIIPINKNFQNSENGIEVFIFSNGVHADIVLPIKNKLYDWSNKVKITDTISKDTNAKYVAFGWGDKGFYLETPTWAELKFSVAFRAAFFLSSSAMHVSFYRNMTTDDLCKKIKISPSQYLKLIQYIENAFHTNILMLFQQ